ncbi:MAG: SWIM zinc finger family protein, partial [Bdellovibrionales bacterium]|nr:SWIM zinc finger family protein [Bdellovibrionales bacterium]
MRQFPRAVLMRGREYFRSGNVSDVTQMGNAFSLTVNGQGERYTVWIDFSQAATSSAIEARCTCPFYAKGSLCKHLWASVIKLERSGLSEKVPGAGPLRILHESGHTGGRQAPRTLDANGSSVHHVPFSGPGWLERLDQIQGKSLNGSAGVTGHMVAAFVIRAADSVATGKLVLDFWPQRKGPAGDTGPLRPGRAPEREFHVFADPRDQELVALLTRTGDPKIVTSFGSPCTRFTVDPILETQVLTTLTGAGKVFLSRSPNGSPDNADRPLRMDRGKPWDLELRVESTGSSYRLEGSLKRDEEHKS